MDKITVELPSGITVIGTKDDLKELWYTLISAQVKIWEDQEEAREFEEKSKVALYSKWYSEVLTDVVRLGEAIFERK